MDQHYPPEYDRGFVEFFYRKFLVNSSVLIPRFETEDLVREAIKTARNESFDVLIDVGTGSGIIPVSILLEVETNNHLSLQTYALDISPEALEVATKNAFLNHVDLEFLESDLLSIFLESVETRRGVSLPDGKNILIVTNLPYIKNEDWENMSQDTRYEPEIALFGGGRTGFELYERLFAQIPAFLEKYNPKKLTILAEMGDDQEAIATKVLTSYGWKFSFFPDAFGIRRFMRIEI